MTDVELIRKAAIGMGNCARLAGPEDTGALSGISLALHVVTGLLGDDVYHQETCAMILDHWKTGNRQMLSNRLRGAFQAIRDSNERAEEVSTDGR